MPRDNHRMEQNIEVKNSHFHRSGPELSISAIKFFKNICKKLFKLCNIKSGGKSSNFQFHKNTQKTPEFIILATKCFQMCSHKQFIFWTVKEHIFLINLICKSNGKYALQMDVWGSEGTAPHISNLVPSLRCEISFTLWLLYPQGKTPSPQHPFCRRLGGSQSQYEHCEGEKSLLPLPDTLNLNFSVIQPTVYSLEWFKLRNRTATDVMRRLQFNP
jgi:hypothetical protein